MVSHIIFAIFAIILSVFLLLLYRRMYSIEKMVYNITEKKLETINKIILEDKYIDRVNLLIDDFIKQASEVYQIMKLSQDDKQYLKAEDAEIMKKYIFGTVKKNMTQDVINAIKSIYVVESDEDLHKILDLRINLYMINFMRQYNDIIEN